MSNFPGFRRLPQPQSTLSPPGSPQRAAPGSPRKRRQFFEVSEEASGDHTIKDFIYFSDPYRTTSIRPRYPVPVLSCRAPKDLLSLFNDDSPLPTLGTEIGEVLKQHQVNDTYMRFLSLSKPGYSDDADNEHVTLLIHATTEDAEEENQWSQARRAVRSLLQDKDIDVHVETVDPVRCYQPSLIPILPDDIYIKIYESFRERMVADLEVALRESWTSMCLYKIGNLLEASEYAVVVMVLPFTIRDWQAFKGQLYDKYMRGAVSPADSIRIHFIPGRVVVEDGRTLGKDFTTTLPTSFPNMGCSIGVDGEFGGGVPWEPS